MLRAEGEEEVEPVGPAGLGLQLRSTDFRFCCVYYTSRCCVAPSKLLNLSGPPFPRLQNGSPHTPQVTGVGW